MKGKEIQSAQGRLKQLEEKINMNGNNFYGYNKKNDFSTVWQDKKILEKKSQNSQNLYTPDNNVMHNVLPTTSSSYGAYYNGKNENYYRPYY